MQNYNLQISNAAFVASGLAIQAKGSLYRFMPDRGRDGRSDSYFGTEDNAGWQMPSDPGLGSRSINKSEESDNVADYWLGRSVLTDIAISVPGQGVLLINDAVINISVQKMIVSTALVGRSGTIKEYITNGDYQVNITVGLIAIDENGKITDRYPERAVAQLREILERPEALEVSSGYLELFGITHLVITGFTSKQMTYSNRQEIEITALSDTDYIIESTEY